MLSLTVRQVLFVFLCISFAFSQFSIRIAGQNIKPYMLVVALMLLLAPFVAQFKGRLGALFFLFSTIVLLLVFSAVWAPVIELALVRVVGLLFLYVTVLCLFFYGVEISHDALSGIVGRFTVLYVLCSLSYFVFGLYMFFVVGYVGEGDAWGERGIYGLYIEGVIPRMRGFSESPNNFVLVLTALIYLNLILVRRRALAVFLLVLCFLLTLSFSGVFSVLLPLALLFLLRAGSFKILGLAFTLTVILWGLFSVFDLSSVLQTRFDRLSSGSGRFDLFLHSIGIIAEAPFGGHGIAQARVLLDGFQGRELQSTHNSFLELALEAGVFVSAIYVVFWVVAVFRVASAKASVAHVRVLICYIVSLFLLNNANLLFYVELMVFNSCLVFLLLANCEREWCRSRSMCGGARFF